LDWGKYFFDDLPFFKVLLLNPPHEVLLCSEVGIVDYSFILGDFALFLLRERVVLLDQLQHIVEVAHVLGQLKAEVIMLELLVIDKRL
jgi:hypothetical protein